MMAVKAWGTQQKTVEEIFFQNEAVSLCLLVNRRARTMRVVDFRAGPNPAKRLFVLSLAQREGVSKIFTLVERDEVQTWVKLGFAKEGNIPGFYKRSDAFLLGCPAAPGTTADPALEGREGGELDELPGQSETRIALGGTVAGASAPMSPAQARMERTIAAAKREAATDGPLPHVKIAPLPETETRKAVATALRSGRALTAFEPFGRDVERRSFVATGRGGFALPASVESQSCFSNAYLEILQSPRNHGETLATAAALEALCDQLCDEEVVSCFALAPSDDVALASAYLRAGFRRTGLLLGHLPGHSIARAGRGDRKDAIVWSRKLASPSED
jgi:hypothetical protein